MNLFKKPTIEQLREKQLEEAKLDLLNAEFHSEAWVAECEKLKKRISRLSVDNINNMSAQLIERLQNAE